MRQRISCVPSAAKPAPSDATVKIRKPTHVGALAAEQVGQPAGGDDQHGRGDHVGQDHPDQRQQAGAEAALQVGQGDDQRAGVDRRQQHPDARAGQSPPLVVRVSGVDAAAALAMQNRKFTSTSDFRPSRSHTFGPMEADREHDIVLFGGTGFTGAPDRRVPGRERARDARAGRSPGATCRSSRRCASGSASTSALLKADVEDRRRSTRWRPPRAS